ncbi:hypothetical protein LC087_16650 [Bacillus carboniphilus]|uniref:Uncharacterized protein n=1 Tax=Bacillus carboniphilus TaxID=86663 RepID=A0ABY9JUA1_9BACI|nr:hypothetical protein [Bacillus carboniphilus]WLR42323.1 hypothetical protein LC087_16650 [Bacillus carboniphilus]
MKDSWKTIDSSYLHKSTFGKIRKDKCELPNGVVIEEYVINEYPDWINAIVLTKDHQMVLVEKDWYVGNHCF